MSKTKEEILEQSYNKNLPLFDIAKDVLLEDYKETLYDAMTEYASQQTSELEGVLSKIKNLALSRSQTLTAISGDEILKLIEDKVNL